MEIEIKWVGDECAIDEKVLLDGITIDLEKLGFAKCGDLITVILETEGAMNQRLKGKVVDKHQNELYTFCGDCSLEKVEIKKSKQIEVK